MWEVCSFELQRIKLRSTALSTSNKPLGKFMLSHIGRGTSHGSSLKLPELRNSPRLAVSMQLRMKVQPHVAFLWSPELGFFTLV